MSSLWGPGNENGSRSNERLSRDDAPDEHTRLLPNRIESRPDLTADDPAVSPYNLWSVRVMRYISIFFTFVAFVWWILMLVSTFATPPGFHTKGSGFFAFSYASLAFSTLAFTLLFFGVPSRAFRILCVIMTVVLLIDAIIMLAVQKTRYEEGWVGVVSVVWALLVSLWTLLADRTVKWGKAEEEERLTGRAETRRTFTEWTEVIISSVAMCILCLVMVLMTLTLILRALDARVAPPGTLCWVDGGKYRIHIYCHGNITDSPEKQLPTVLLEGGSDTVEDGLWQFANDALKNGTISRFCFADRPGFAWSDTAPSPLSAGMAATAMSEALARAGERGPWVIASAGVGTIYSRVFASQHGDEVKGILLIDPLHEDLLHRLSSSKRGFLLWLRGIISPLGIDRLIGAVFRGRSSADRIWGRSVRQTGKYIFARLQEGLVADSLTKREVESSRAIQYKDTPLVVVTSGVHIRQDSVWEQKQRDLTRLTENLRHWDIVDDAPHEVWKTLEGRKKIEKRLRQLVHARGK